MSVQTVFSAQGIFSCVFLSHAMAHNGRRICTPLIRAEKVSSIRRKAAWPCGLDDGYLPWSKVGWYKYIFISNFYCLYIWSMRYKYILDIMVPIFGQKLICIYIYNVQIGASHTFIHWGKKKWLMWGLGLRRMSSKKASVLWSPAFWKTLHSRTSTGFTDPSWLVVWNMGFYDFPYTGNNDPNWPIFFRGAETTN